MFRFEDIGYLHLLWLLPILVILYIGYLRLRKYQRSQLGSSTLLSSLIDGERPQRSHVKMGLITTAMLSFILACANPQWGTKKEKVKAESSDIFIALDISQSMMAEDISPNRIERAKRLALNLIQALKGNRIGLILFAGNAYLQMPLTSDYAAAELFITSANTGQATTQGTAIGDAIQLGLRTYEPDENTKRAMIIITDGETHDEQAIDLAGEALERGLSVYAIGVGTTEGALIPYQSSAGQQYKRDDTGELVTSRLNPGLIQDLASSGGGRSYMIGEGNSIITSLKSEMERLEKQEVEQRAFTDYDSYFQYLIGIGAILLLLQWLIPDKANLSTLS